MNYDTLLHKAIIASVIAGDEILKVYDTNFKVEIKSDHSPVTQADKKASDVIINYLKEFNIPVLSEEDEHPSFDIRKHWDKLWIVDPLDGTKEFVKRNGEFTVNIALVENQIPVIGVIYSPVFKDLYFASKHLGSFKIQETDLLSLLQSIENTSLNQFITVAKKLPIVTDRKNYVVVASRSHLNTETYKYIEHLKLQHQTVDIINTGSSIKMCLIAEGVADEYPRFGPTMEWDTAAGNAILLYANGGIIDDTTKQPMLYNKESLFNNWFVAKAN